MPNKIVALLLVALGTQACAPLGATGISNYTPAIRVNITPESQAELQQVVASSIGLPSVRLMTKVLTQKPTFYIEKSKLLGFDLDKPTTFKLFKHQNKCVLLNQKTKKTYELLKVECTAL